MTPKSRGLAVIHHRLSIKTTAYLAPSNYAPRYAYYARCKACGWDGPFRFRRDAARADYPLHAAARNQEEER